jgi:hypothetical protein
MSYCPPLKTDTGYLNTGSMTQTNHFFNPGDGWLCKHCSAEDSERKQQTKDKRARLSGEGGAEEKEPRLSTVALARWTDATRQALVCPRCSIEEMISKA